MTYTFTFYFRLDCEDYKYPYLAGADTDGALDIAQSALVPMWNHKRKTPIDYATDIAPRITVAVDFLGYDRPISDVYACAEYSATVGSEDLALLRDLRRWATDVWDDEANVEDYPFSPSVEETDADLIPSSYANCAACGFTTDRCVEKPDGRFLCVPCDDHEMEG